MLNGEERHIKPTRVRDAHAIMKGRYVITAWQRGVHCTKGIYEKDRDKVIPKEVLVHMREHTNVLPQKPEIPKRKPKKHGVSRSRRGK